MSFDIQDPSINKSTERLSKNNNIFENQQIDNDSKVFLLRFLKHTLNQWSDPTN